ncbi:MAG: endonuclease Q family protein [Candidatus Aminicenantes bacterium]|nr:endonuclease Q family protein [Candidatus Aminicenantes bacterium]MDH5384676.1 endonuclease Q family protein [Candidatus Aminicenantes bacterium]MDH5742271.1 endonuclease Q family protein [Candidatus Aminicenantes bacterium]
MKYIADLHIHSKFSRATSRETTLDILAYWAKIKGISLLATGDFTHPEWLFLAKEKLEPAGNGFFRLKNILFPENGYLRSIPISSEDLSFILTAELSFIYSKKGKVRKIHILLLAPDFESVDKINSKLSCIGNLRSDGRPILGMDAKDFVKIVANTCPRCVVIPAHIWTPWFSLFGANSGFDVIEDCFEEMTPFIFALETGLSSDPSMNWRLSALDKYALVSNSDAHSPSKIGREANVFSTESSYDALVDAIKSKDPTKFLHTIEFFPEEGKYHYDGHRKCHVIFSPQETIQHKYICPRCGGKITVGVMHRVESLSDRDRGYFSPTRIPYKNLIPLNEIVAQALDKTSECKSVWDLYFRFIHEFQDEHTILTEVPIDQLARLSPERVSVAIDRMRKGQVKIIPGHDGEFGKIRLFDEDKEEEEAQGQLRLF